MHTRGPRRRQIISRRRLTGVLATLSSLQAVISAGAAYSGSNSATLWITASVLGDCLVSNTTINFGAFTALAGTPANPKAITQSASVGIPYVCSSGTRATLYAQSNVMTLTGSNAANTLLANLYSDPAFRNPFPIAPSTFTVNGSGGTGASQIYAKLLPSTSTKPDTYSGHAQLTFSY